MEFERSIDVAAGPAAAFALATDLARSPEWVSSIEGFEITEGDGRGVGTRFKQLLVDGMVRLELTGEVLEYSAPEHARYRLTGQDVVMEAELRVEPQGDGSRLSHSARVELQSFALKMVGSMIRQKLEEKLDRDLAALAARL